MPQSLEAKLQVKPGKRVVVLGAPSGFALGGARGKGPYDIVLLFAVDQKALARSARRAIESLAPEGILWIAYPKKTGALPTDLSRDEGWEVMNASGYEGVSLVAIDHTWSAMRFKKGAPSRAEARAARATAPPLETPPELAAALAKKKHRAARERWEALAPSHKKEFVQWIAEAKKDETRARRLEKTLEMLAAGETRS